MPAADTVHAGMRACLCGAVLHAELLCLPGPTQMVEEQGPQSDREAELEARLRVGLSLCLSPFGQEKGRWWLARMHWQRGGRLWLTAKRVETRVCTACCTRLLANPTSRLLCGAAQEAEARLAELESGEGVDAAVRHRLVSTEQVDRLRGRVAGQPGGVGSGGLHHGERKLSFLASACTPAAARCALTCARCWAPVAQELAEAENMATEALNLLEAAQADNAHLHDQVQAF